MHEFGPIVFPEDGSVLAGIDFAVDDTAHVALFGPNGAGKSSLLRGIAGTLPGSSRRTDVAYLPQQAHLFRGTGRSNLALGDGDATTATRLAETLGMGAVLDDDVRTLSVGQRQRLALARVLASDAPIVLLDEPLAPIDTTDRRMVIATIRDHTVGRALITVTHSVTDAAALADELVVMDAGEVLQRGPVSHVLSHPSGARVASIIGVTNVLEGEVVEAGDAMATIDVEGVRIPVPAPLTIGDRALIRIGAESVVLYDARPDGGSHRTVIEGRVAAMQPVGVLVEVHIDEPVPLTALVTAGTVDSSDLAPGTTIWLGVKSAAVSVIWSG